MNNEKKAPVLTLEHLTPYLPYGLKCHNMGNADDEGHAFISEIVGLDHDFNVWVSHEHEECDYAYRDTFPLLCPLSEYKDLNSRAMNDLNTDLQIQIEIWDLANKKISFHSLSYGTAIECFANHIDVFGLIEKGLAIDINSIEGKETKGNG